ncbi:MAG: deacetylase [Methylococcaceae bacterium]|nr:deacetylase [Methylococcaceae bacterium]
MYNFDPSYGYSLEKLLRIATPASPDNFAEFWQARYEKVMLLTSPYPRLKPSSQTHPNFECYDINYRSTNNYDIGGWLLIPKNGSIRRGIIVGHGYGGRDGPDFHLPIDNAAFLFPCFRGLSRSRRWPISDNPSFHVLHDIDKKDHYILGGCVEDLWLAVSVLLNVCPAVSGHIAYLGISFGGGIGALALPWESRIQRAHLNVPSFGNHPLRLQLPTLGSAAAVQAYQRERGNALATLAYYDAAIASRYTQAPVHVAAALADPVVSPPGQFSIYNALPPNKKLFLLDWGHADYAGQFEQQRALLSDLQEFLHDL